MTTDNAHIPKITPGMTAEEALEKLRQAIKAQSGAQRPLRVSTVEPASSLAAAAGKPMSGQEVYARLVAEGRLLGRERSSHAILSNGFSLASMRKNLEDCRTVLRFYDVGPQRTGFAGRLADFVTSVTKRVLNWFITPSMMFDRSAASALEEAAAALERLQSQVLLLSSELRSVQCQSQPAADSGNSSPSMHS